MPDNLLYYGDNLDILRGNVADESVEYGPEKLAKAMQAFRMMLGGHMKHA